MIFKKIFGKKEEDFTVLMQKGMFEEALKVLEKEIEKKPKDVFLLIKQAECYEKLNQIGKACSIFEKVAGIFMEDGFLAKAMAIEKKIEKLDPSKAKDTSKVIAKKLEEVKKEPFWKEKAIPYLFADFGQEELEMAISLAKVKNFKAGDVIWREGEMGSSILCITSGKVEVKAKNLFGKEVKLAELKERDFLGEVAYITKKPRTATIIALEDTEVLEFEESAMDEIISKFPEVKKIMEKYYLERANKTVEAFLEEAKKEKI
jgi:tetratricopeptide (TPR) repeat protein